MHSFLPPECCGVHYPADPVVATLALNVHLRTSIFTFSSLKLTRTTSFHNTLSLFLQDKLPLLVLHEWLLSESPVVSSIPLVAKQAYSSILLSISFVKLRWSSAKM